MKDKENNIEIKSVKINIGKRDIELSIEECKKLKDALDELFVKEIVIIPTIVKETPLWPVAPVCPPYQPIWHYTCGGTTSGQYFDNVTITNNTLAFTII